MKALARLRRQWFFWLVTAAVYFFLLGPIVAVALASLEGKQTYHFQFPPETFSLAWYARIPQKYVHALGVSLALASVTATIATLVGAAAAIGIVRGGPRYREALQAFFNLPLQVPFVVTGVVFLQFYNQLAILSGIDFLGSLAGLVIAHVFVTIPYSIGTVGSVLARANPRLEEAARTLGASEWSIFKRVLLPMLKPGVFAGFFYAFIVSFGDVPIAVFIASGGFVTLPVEIFQSLQFDFEPAVLALSTLVVIFSVLLIVGMQKLAGFDLVLPAAKR
ncbi:MAG TPA: ABC transporter permease [Alphaproteobacteria bacterium]|nr:ABC transporter permease [Alphaproteobacteria bacterium]